MIGIFNNCDSEVKSNKISGILSHVHTQSTAADLYIKEVGFDEAAITFWLSEAYLN